MTTNLIVKSRLFPSAEVESALRAELLDSIAATATLYGTRLPDDRDSQCATSLQLDSLDVVGMLCKLEPIVGFELQDSLVKIGGYRSVNEAMSHLMPRIKAVWDKCAAKGKKK